MISTGVEAPSSRSTRKKRPARASYLTMGRKSPPPEVPVLLKPRAIFISPLWGHVADPEPSPTWAELSPTTTSRCRRMMIPSCRCCRSTRSYQAARGMSCRGHQKPHMRQRHILPRPLSPAAASQEDWAAGCADAGMPWGDDRSGHDRTSQFPAIFSRSRYPSCAQI